MEQHLISTASKVFLNLKTLFAVQLGLDVVQFHFCENTVFLCTDISSRTHTAAKKWIENDLHFMEVLVHSRTFFRVHPSITTVIDVSQYSFFMLVDYKN